ncbi:MAG: YihY/virulence factor BrkB family protein [Lachnospiraceae bacterium]|nr:YihY/virulence factor BrkB family protein [Lachnospiraceae bacterium]MEE1256948.1 YihY/virulence factor BrkB family protein [Lachnospiraceae bacterium]
MQVKNKIISGIKKVNPYIRTFQKIQKEVNISAHASSAAFFLFLSIIPVIIIVCALLQHAPTVQIEIWSYLSEAVIPKTISDFLMDIVNTYQGNSMTLVSVSAIITAWSASKGMLALMRGMNAVYELQESRNYIMLRLRALVYTVFFMIAILLSIVLLVFGNTVVALLSDILIVSEIWRWLQSLRHLIVAVILAVVFCSFYCLLPNNRMPWREQLPGAFVAAVFWIVYSFFFSIYIDYFNGFSMYGSLTTVIIVMIWLYFCMYIFFCGVVINRLLCEKA